MRYECKNSPTPRNTFFIIFSPCNPAFLCCMLYLASLVYLGYRRNMSHVPFWSVVFVPQGGSHARCVLISRALENIQMSECGALPVRRSYDMATRGRYACLRLLTLPILNAMRRRHQTQQNTTATRSSGRASGCVEIGNSSASGSVTADERIFSLVNAQSLVPTQSLAAPKWACCPTSHIRS